MHKKGIFPYEYSGSVSRLEETSLSPREGNAFRKVIIKFFVFGHISHVSL